MLGRRVATGACYGLGLLALTLVGLIVFRESVVETLAVRYLTQQGIPVKSLRVTELGIETVLVDDIELGRNAELKAGGIRISFSPLAILAGHIGAIEIKRPVLKLDLTGDNPLLGSLEPLAEGGDGTASSAPGYGVVRVEDGRIDTLTPIGPVVVEVFGDIRGGERGDNVASAEVVIDGEGLKVDALVEASMESDGTLRGKVLIEDGTITLPAVNIAGLQGEASFQVVGDMPPTVTADLVVGEIALQQPQVFPSPFKQSAVRVLLRGADASLDGTLRTIDDEFAVRFSVDVGDYLETPSIVASVNGKIHATAPVFDWLGLPPLSAGDLNINAEVQGTTPPFKNVKSGIPAFLSALLDDRHHQLHSILNVNVQNVTSPDRFAALSGRAEITSKIGDDALEVTFAQSAELEARHISPTWLNELGIPVALAELISDGVVLDVAKQPASILLTRNGSGFDLGILANANLDTPGGASVKSSCDLKVELDSSLEVTQLSFDDVSVVGRNFSFGETRISQAVARGALAGTLDNFSGDLELMLEVGALSTNSVTARQSSARIPVSVDARRDGATLQVSEAVRLTVEEVQVGEYLRSRSPLAFDIRSGEIRLEISPDDDVTIHHGLAIESHELDFVIERNSDPPMNVRGGFGGLEINGILRPQAPYEGRVTVSNAEVFQPDLEFGLSGIEGHLKLPISEGGEFLRFSVEDIKDLRTPPLVAPLMMQGTVDDMGVAYELSAQIAGQDGTDRIVLAGRYFHAEERGVGYVELEPIEFVRDGLQPDALFPQLHDLRDVEGMVHATAEVYWSPGEFGGSGVLVLRDLELATDEFTIEGLAVRLRLNEVFPPVSPPAQRLTVGEINPGLPLNDVSIYFRIGPGLPPLITIEDSEVALLGGRISVADFTVDATEERHSFILDVDSLDLEEVLTLANVEGLYGTGKLSGAIPVTLDGDSIIIEPGKLETHGPGELRFQSQPARDLLSSGGEQVDLLLRALEDFHYEELSISLRKSAGHDVYALLSVLGNNPDVAEGRAFKLNVNLETNIGPLLHAVNEGYRFSNDAFRRLWGLK